MNTENKRAIMLGLSTLGECFYNMADIMYSISGALASEVTIEGAEVHDLDKLKPVKATGCCGGSCQCKEDGK